MRTAGPCCVAAVLLVLSAAACGATAARPTSAAPAGSCPADHPALMVSEDVEAKLAAHLRVAVQRRELCTGQPRYFVVESATALTAAEQRTLVHLGARAQHPVTFLVHEGHRDAVHVGALPPDAPSAVWLIVAPGDALPFLATLPWVTRLSIPTAYIVLPTFAPAVAGRIGPGVWAAVDATRVDPPFALGLIGRVEGCLDADRRAAVARLGVLITTVSEHPDCATHPGIIGFGVPLGAIEDLAALPWIRSLEVPMRLHPL